MVSDNRVKHDPLTRSLALELFERGFGYMFVSSHLGIPRDTVRQWYYKYSAIGPGGVLMMGGKQKKYSYDLKLEAAKAVVERGMSYSEAMALFKIASLAPLKRWCKLYREGGEMALLPKAKGRPSASKSKATEVTEVDMLKAKILRLEAENACLKKAQALKALENFPTEVK